MIVLSLVWLVVLAPMNSLRKSDSWRLALACLQDDKFEKMKIHFLYEKGYDPVAMDLVKTRLQQVCDKPGGIQIVANEIVFPENHLEF